VKDTRSPAHRLAQAHLDLLLGYLDAGDGPSTGRQVPHITMTIDFDALTQAVSAAALDFGGPVGPAVARRLLCDAQIMPVVLGGDGLVLDVGRAERTFPPHLRRALALRDGGCAWPGCDRPPGWCDAHHILWWLHGDETCLLNGVLLSDITIASSTATTIGSSEWPPTADPTSSHPHTSTRNSDRCATSGSWCDGSDGQSVRNRRPLRRRRPGAAGEEGARLGRW
jgi:hypothetical protein